MRALKLIAVLIFVVILFMTSVYVWMFKSAGTNVAFQSSDKQWADSEVLFKGRDFKSIVVYFYMYKLKCNKPNVKLERLTKKPEWYTLENLFNDYDDPKWQVPLGVGNKHTLSGYYPPAYANNCYNKAVSMKELNLAELKSRAFINNLKKTHNSSLQRTALTGRR